MDMAPTILILSPVLMPIITAAAIDPVDFSAVFMMNLAVALNTRTIGAGLDGSRQSAKFVIRDFGGDWIGAVGRNPATGRAGAGKKLPITMQESIAAALEFAVRGSQVSTKCANLTIEANSVGKDVFEGTVGREPAGVFHLTAMARSTAGV